ncbi:2759_t:CDS:2 [Paraglomus occultum]|uniref:2759_t:CDS:1 n=1 Tax=Paraglomus occultum TaxID=144539 RepID=A0A9N9AQI4_9GLOM|nr:2759_t:CDS:2 [Paraglomus occultum]
MVLIQIISFFFSPITSLIEPYVTKISDALTSEKTQRVAVKSIFVGFSITLLLLFAFIAYIAFYWTFVPEISHEYEVFLNYSDGHPKDVVNMTRYYSEPKFLTDQQLYDVSVLLHVPFSQKNKDLGNFMIHVELKSRLANDETVRVADKPCILTYQSPLLQVFSTVWRLFPLLMGYSKEDQTLVVKMIDNVIEDSKRPISHALVGISNPLLETYKVLIRFDAHFSGLRYFMYYHPVSTAFSFILIFLVVELIFSVFAWRSIVSRWQAASPPLVPPASSPVLKPEYQDGLGTNGEDEGLGEVWEDIERTDSSSRNSVSGQEEGTDVDSEAEQQYTMQATARIPESGGSTYTTEFYTDDDSQSVQSSVVGDLTGQLTDDDVDEFDGSVTPTTHSRRSTISSTDNDTDQDRPAVGTSTGRLPLTTGSVYTRVPGSGVGDSDNSARDGGT